jgi:deferrochelatase/peroxidase EfeB
LDDGTYVVVQGFSSNDEALRRIALLQQKQHDASGRVKPRAQPRDMPGGNLSAKP